MQSRGQWLCLPGLSGPSPQRHHHHLGTLPNERFNPALHDLGLERPEPHILLYVNWLIYILTNWELGCCSPKFYGAISCHSLVFCYSAHQLNRLDTLTTAQGIESLSISPSLITLTILPSVQVPTTMGTCWENSDLSGTTRKTTSSSHPAISFTWTLNITKPSGWVLVPPTQARFRGWLTRSCSGSMGTHN